MVSEGSPALFFCCGRHYNTFVLLLGISRMRRLPLLFIRIFSCALLVWWELVEQFSAKFEQIVRFVNSPNWPALSRTPQYLSLSYILSSLRNQVPKLGNHFSHSFLTSNYFFFAIKYKGHGDLITFMCRKLKFIRHLCLTIYPSIFLTSFPIIEKMLSKLNFV